MAEEGISVLLSSHVVADIERVCDYLVMISGGQVQVAGDIDALLGSHHLLIGPRLSDGAGLPGLEVVKANHTEQQSSVWVRGHVRQLPEGWREAPLPLEELVITYISVPGAGSLPRPELEEARA